MTEPRPDAPRDPPAPYRIWGADLIDPNAVAQLDAAMRLPMALRGALLPDAHLGYGLPIGGVMALDGAVSPYAVGVDIACRMRLTVFESAVEARSAEALLGALQHETRFGAGVGFDRGDRNEDAVLDDPLWDEHPFLSADPRLRDTAHVQLGSSGGGNHFVEFGAYRELGPDGNPAGPARLALLSHSGSRGLGAKIAGHYAKLAQRLHPQLPNELRHLGWLDLASDDGDAYWRAMQLAGRYAAANHAAIHRRLANGLVLPVRATIENHHNFAWLERVRSEDGREVEAVVHRKGATPAGPDVLGIVPGSMATPAYVVRGLGHPESLSSASHGAGRTMSRNQAKRVFKGRDLHAEMEARGIVLVGGALDEAPDVYKPVEAVLAEQADLIVPVARFVPRVVRMARD